MDNANISFSLGEYQDAVAIAMYAIRRDNIPHRIQTKDYTVWKQEPDEIVNRLGWLDAPAETLKKSIYIRATLKPLIKNIDDVVLLGIGGSSLAAEVFSKIFRSHAGYPKLHIVDTTDPAYILKITRRLNLKKTVFLVSSKSGTTLEVISLFKYFYNLTFKKSGNNAGNRFVFITDKGSPLTKIAKNIFAYHIFLNNPDIGGRYSALSFPGIIPAAIIGVDVEKLLQKATDKSETEKEYLSGAYLGAVLGTLALAGRDKLTLLLPSRWKSFGDWLEQLIAESTGKEGKGILPVLNEPIQDNFSYGKDRVFVFFQNKKIKYSPMESLISAGHPVITVNINDDYDLGAQMFIWEMATAVATHYLGVNPFDQPGVEAAKKYARRIIAEYTEKKKYISDQQPALSSKQGDVYGNITDATPAEAFTNFLKQAVAGDYICLQIYLSPSPKIDAAINYLCESIRRKYSLPVTYGYGPLYLHSTGQLHKGDSGNGLFIQLTQDNSLDVDIPDDIGKEKSSLTFGALKAAQAKGDWQALKDAKRRVIRFHCKANSAAGLKNLAELLF